MNKAYFLSTCSTCKRILAEVDPDSILIKQDIKTEQITENQIDEMAKLSGSYESLFSRRAQKYRQLGLHEKQLTEQDIRQHILGEYTFLKRPVFIINHEIFVGNSKKTVEQVKAALSK